MTVNLRQAGILSLIAIVWASFLLFTQLGASALWDDEATTALFALSVSRTGDTHAVIGNNIVAYQSGLELVDLKNRVISPLAFYLTAPFVGLSPESALAARVPFAICGLLTVGLVVLWLWQAKVHLLTWLLVLSGLLTNVSFFLYSRQCRYYGAVILLSTLIAYCYSLRGKGDRYTIGLILSSVLLLSANYLCYAGVMACLFVDYVCWGRKQAPYRWTNVGCFVLAQVICGFMLVGIYNPLSVTIWDMPREAWWIEKLTLLGWHWRELNSNEFGVGIMIMLGAMVAFRQGEIQARRAIVALVVYVTLITLLSPQPLNLLSVAFVRYLIPVIPLCIWISVLVLQYVHKSSRMGMIVLAALAFGTNVLHGGPWVGIDNKTVFSSIIAKGEFRSTIAQYVQELLNPPPSAYKETAQWIKSHVSSGKSVWVAPGYATYPLMYHAPQAIYAWQLKEKETQFEGLDEVHFYGVVEPEYIVAFGPYQDYVKSIMNDSEVIAGEYALVKQIDRYWYDLTRPELFWHSFSEVKGFSKDRDAVYIYKRQSSKQSY